MKFVLVRYIKTYSTRYRSTTRQKPTTIEKINQDTCAFTPRKKYEGDTTVLLTSGGGIHDRNGEGKTSLVKYTEYRRAARTFGRKSMISPKQKKRKATPTNTRGNGWTTHHSSEVLRDPYHVEVPLIQVHGLATPPSPCVLLLWLPLIRADTPTSAYDFSGQRGYFGDVSP